MTNKEIMNKPTKKKSADAAQTTAQVNAGPIDTARLSIYCSTNDRFPIHLVDIVELFWTELRSRGVQQHWYSPGRNTPGPFRTEKVNGIPVTVSPAVSGFGGAGVALNTFIEWVADTWCLLKQLRGDADVIQVRDKYWAAVVAWLVTRVTGARFVTWLSFPYPEADLDRAAHAGLLKRTYLRMSGLLGQNMLYRFAMRRADLCFVQTEEMKRSLLPFGIPADKMIPVPMGVTPRALEFRKGQQARVNDVQAKTLISEHIAPGTQTIFYLGTLNRSRELDIMIDALAIVVKQNPNARLLVVGGEDNPGDLAFLQERAAQLGVTDSVHFTGWMPIEKAWVLLEQADVCWSPIVNNRVLRVGSPTKLVEYMAFQKPVVANEHPEQRQILDESGAGYCVPWSAEGFAAATLKLFGDPEQARRMGEQGLPWVQSNRVYDGIAERVLAEYDKMLSPRGAVGTLQRDGS